MAKYCQLSKHFLPVPMLVTLPPVALETIILLVQNKPTHYLEDLGMMFFSVFTERIPSSEEMAMISWIRNTD